MKCGHETNKQKITRGRDGVARPLSSVGGLVTAGICSIFLVSECTHARGNEIPQTRHSASSTQDNVPRGIRRPKCTNNSPDVRELRMGGHGGDGCCERRPHDHEATPCELGSARVSTEFNSIRAHFTHKEGRCFRANHRSEFVLGATGRSGACDLKSETHAGDQQRV